ncbi:MAG: alpha-galactosidase [Treponema sp.]|nr:alpha-galactosidase [Treponema sp.]
MKINYYEKSRIFSIETENTGYYIAIVDSENFIGHIHYGKKINPEDNLPSLLRIYELPLVPSKNNRERLAFYDSFQWEYPCGGTGDFRESCLNVDNKRNQSAVQLSYVSHEIISGKPKLKGLPSTWGSKEDSLTLIIHAKDSVLNLKVDLLYSIFNGIDAIARSAYIKNEGTSAVNLTKAYSACLDMDNRNFDMISLNGGWARERHIERNPLFHGKSRVCSLRGETSHQQNNFIALAEHNADNDSGDAYGMSLVYSGNFIAQAELTQFESVRTVIGMHSEGFSWHLEPGEDFTVPEAALVYSDKGLNCMSQRFHDLWRQHLIQGKFKDTERPILINNWEATYFNFDTDKLLDIAKEAKKDGIEMLVMDDGWFGHRNNDDSSLGDWTVNEAKIKGGLKNLVDKINNIGMKFGIWFEPEMISPDSELYKSHPDWAIKVQDRTASLCRCQYVLDLSRKEVCDYAYESVAKILRSANIEYVKWDMNRQLSDLGSAELPAERSGELSHRYVLGLYSMQERLIKEFPNLLLENCSGGGARFDAGMLYYSPQIWCSDDTDAIERLEIQEGTALVYPLSSMGAHVSVCPNHTCGRNTPFRTRGFTALAGTFGYELDITKLSEEEKKIIPEQISMYKKYNKLIRTGDYYRLNSYSKNKEYDSWQVISKDKKEALITMVQVMSRANYHSYKIYAKALESNTIYNIQMEDSEGNSTDLGTWTGSTLCNAGLIIPRIKGDFHSQLIHISALHEKE